MLVNKVREFTGACHDNLPQTPKLIEVDRIDFLRDMINSELDEMEDAIEEEDYQSRVVGQYDAMIDILVYVADSCVRAGYNVDPAFDYVHQANMRKIVDGKVLKNSVNKVIKPEGWHGPEEEIKTIVTNHLRYGSWGK